MFVETSEDYRGRERIKVLALFGHQDGKMTRGGEKRKKATEQKNYFSINTLFLFSIIIQIWFIPKV